MTLCVPGECSERSCASPGSALCAARGKLHETRDPYVDGPRLARALQRADRIACDHMSGLLVRSHMTAGLDGFRDVSSKQRSGFECHWVPRSVSRLGSIDHTICLLEQAPASVRGDGRSRAELVMRWSSRPPPAAWCAIRARGVARSPHEAQRRAPRGPRPMPSPPGARDCSAHR